MVTCKITTIFLLIIAEVRPQFFDFLGFPPTIQNTRYGNDYTTRRTKIDTIKTIEGVDSQITWKNTTISIVYEGLEREGTTQTKEKKRKNTIVIQTPIYNLNYESTTPKTIRKTSKTTNRRRIISQNLNRGNENSRLTTNHGNANAGFNDDRDDGNKNKRVPLSGHDVDVSKTRLVNDDWYDRPVNYIPDVRYTDRPYYEQTTKAYNYNNKNTFKNDYYTTKNPYLNRPGVRPLVPENRPPITNRPATRKPVNPVTTRPRPATNKPTIKPYIINPIPTDSGALVYPHEDEPPDIIKGPDEDSMTNAEKRRYIDIAEKMCDKYKSLNTKHIQAIPLLPSPDPVQVNVSKCTPTTIPLVVGGKVVTINEFPHMALLGWIKLEGAGYSWKCGGSLISDQYVLTAAHCSYQERDNTVITGPPRVVQLGSSYLDDPGALVVRVGGVIRHPKYKFPKSYFDIALLKLVQKVSFSDVIKPACLGVPPPVGAPIIATGWGRTELGGDQSVDLRSVSLPVWDMNKCHQVLGTSRKMPDGARSDSQLCAGEQKGGKDTCQGDSGGPAQVQDGCAWRVVAVTSLGRSCGAPNTPGLYALVHRVFVSAQVFGNHNRNNRDSDDRNNHQNTNWQTTQRNRDNSYNRPTTENYNNQNYDRQNNEFTNNNNGRTKHDSDSTWNNQRNGNNQQGDYYSQNQQPNNSGNNNRGRNDYTYNNRNQNEHGNNEYPSGQQNYYSNNNQQGNNNNEQNYYINNKNPSGYWVPSHENTRRQIQERYEEGRVWFT